VNVVLIVADTWRRDHMGCYGNDWIRTPSVDELAKMGTVFENCNFGSYPTLPCRNDILTGRYEFPWRGWGGPDKDAVTLSGLVSKSDRVAYLITDVYHHWRRGGGTFWWDFTGFELVRGQERDGWITDTDLKIKYPAPQYEQDDSTIGPHLKNAKFSRHREEDWFAPKVFSQACRWIKHNRKHKNFFLMVDAFDPHEPWDPPRSYVSYYGNPTFEGNEYVAPTYGPVEGYLTEEEFKHVQALYAAEVTMVDRWIGKLVNQIKHAKLLDKTMIIVTSDHGTYNGDHGLVGKNRQLYRCLSHTPMVVWHPEFAHGKRLENIVQPVDLFPTILEAVGLDVPDDIHGRSWLGALEADGEGDSRDAALFGWHDQWCNVTDGRYVLHRPLGDDDETMLFDLEKDPGEENNLAKSKAKAKQLSRMSALLLDKLKEIDAPAELIAKLASS